MRIRVGRAQAESSSQAGPATPGAGEQGVQHAVLGVEDEDEDRRRGGRRQDGGDVVDRPEDAAEAHRAVEQQGQRQGGDQRQGHLERGEQQGHLDRRPERGVVPEQVDVVADADPLGRVHHRVSGEAQVEGVEHRDQGEGQETEDRRPRHQVEPESGAELSQSELLICRGGPASRGSGWPPRRRGGRPVPGSAPPAACGRSPAG